MTSSKASVGSSSSAGTVLSRSSHGSRGFPASSCWHGAVNAAIMSEKSSTINPSRTSSSIAPSSRDSRSLTLASMGGLSSSRAASYERHVRHALGSETPSQFSGPSLEQRVDFLIRSATYPSHVYPNINFTQRLDLMITSDQPHNQYRYLQVAPMPSQHYFYIPPNQIIQQYDTTTMPRQKTGQVPNTRNVVGRSPGSTYEGHLNRDIIESYVALEGPIAPERMRIFGEAVKESQWDDERRRFYVQVYGTHKLEGILLERAQGHRQNFQAIQEWINDYWRRNSYTQEAWMNIERPKFVPPYREYRV